MKELTETDNIQNEGFSNTYNLNVLGCISLFLIGIGALGIVAQLAYQEKYKKTSIRKCPTV